MQSLEQRSALHEEFEQARQAAVELTDRYRDTPVDAPERAALWDRVVRQTEIAQALLQSWLAETDPARSA